MPAPSLDALDIWNLSSRRYKVLQVSLKYAVCLATATTLFRVVYLPVNTYAANVISATNAYIHTHTALNTSSQLHDPHYSSVNHYSHSLYAGTADSSTLAGKRRTVSTFFGLVSAVYLLNTYTQSTGERYAHTHYGPPQCFSEFVNYHTAKYAPAYSVITALRVLNEVITIIQTPAYSAVSRCLHEGPVGLANICIADELLSFPVPLLDHHFLYAWLFTSFSVLESCTCHVIVHLTILFVPLLYCSVVIHMYIFPYMLIVIILVLFHTSSKFL